MRTLITLALLLTACASAKPGDNDVLKPYDHGQVCEAPTGIWQAKLTLKSSRNLACKPSDLREWSFDAASYADCMVVSATSEDAGCHTTQHLRCQGGGFRDTTFALDYAGPREWTGTLVLELQQGSYYCDGTFAVTLTR